jgi:pimeloyl-ACP methyl ester carboxylesterase
MDEIRLGSSSYLVPFAATDGIRLNGFLTSGTRKPKRCIIFIHGMYGSAFSYLALSFAKNLPKDLALFSMNNRGQGVVSGFSKRVRGKRKRVMAGTGLERFEDSVFDIRGAINALSGMGYKNFVLCGHSTGCQKAVYYQYRMHDRRVKGIVLIAPCDDYNLNRRGLGSRHARMRRVCARMIRSGKGNTPVPGGSGLSAQRLDSLTNPKRIESRLFNYDGELKEFGSIKTPILAVFGAKEEYTIKRVGRCLDLLEGKAGSKRFTSLLIPDANHAFDGKERELVKKVEGWMREL